MDVSLIEQELEVEFHENLLAFQDTVPRYMKNKKARRQKKKSKKEGKLLRSFDDYIFLILLKVYFFLECVMNEILASAKVKMWSACKFGDNELLSSVINSLLTQVEKSMTLEEQNKEDVTIDSSSIISKDDVIKLVNDPNEDGNTMLHLAALGGHLKLVWYIVILLNLSLSFFCIIIFLPNFLILGNY